MTAKQRQGQLGVVTVEKIVLCDWKARWQSIDAVNDDGLDGLIFFEKNYAYSGQTAYVQVKCTKPKKTTDGKFFTISLNRSKLRANWNVWSNVASAMIIVYVNPEDWKAYWVQARGEFFTDTQIKIPTNNIFDSSSKKIIQKLCGTLHIDNRLPLVSTQAGDFAYLQSKEHLQVTSRKFYTSLNREKLRFVGSASPITFTRHGWHHITRPTRKRAVQIQSMNLLGTIKPILKQTKEANLKVFSKINQLYYVTAQVSSTFRQAFIVTIVFKKHFLPDGMHSFSFHSVYEPRRNRNILGI